MNISEPQITSKEGRLRATWQVTLENDGATFEDTGTAQRELWIDWPKAYFQPEQMNSDAALLILFPLAMRLGERILVEGYISGHLIWNVLEAMEIYQSYFPGYARVVPLEARTREIKICDTGRTGSFYSGGVDSLFNVAEALRLSRVYGTAPVTDLWLIRGMDVNLTQDALWTKVHGQLSAPEQLPEGLNIVDIWTNARDIHGKIVGWEQMGFSPILGGIAKCFAARVGHVLIGSYGKYEEVGPYASTPLVDSMWSCDAQLVRHFTCRANRAKKISRIIEILPNSLNILRVCWKNPNGSYNCGICEKCMRTQMQLEIYGMLESCPTFDVRLTTQTLQDLVIPWQAENFHARDFWSDLSNQAKRAGLNEHAAVIDAKLSKARARARLASLFFTEKWKLGVKRLVRPS